MKYLLCISVLISLCLFCFAGCNGKEDLVTSIQSTATDSQTTEYYDNSSPIDVSDFNAINVTSIMPLTYPQEMSGSFSRVFHLTDLKSQFGDFCLRYNQGRYYAVFNVLNEDGIKEYLFLLFNEYLTVDDGMLVYKLVNKSDFEILQNGLSSLNDIKKIDPGVLVYDGLGETGKQALSYHRCVDGTLVIVHYDMAANGYIVNDIEYEKDPTQFVKLLLPIDLTLIN